MKERDVVRCIDYPRLFLVLGVVTAVLIFTARWRPGLGAASSVAVYAVLHSSVLDAALAQPQTAWKKAAFVAAAAALASLSYLLAQAASHWFAAAGGMVQPVLLLALCSGLGAAGDGLLVRQFWARNLPAVAVVWITLACVTSTLVALPLGSWLHVLGSAWFATMWWWAFSVALWYFDGRQLT
jgi:hypothetical protein